MAFLRLYDRITHSAMSLFLERIGRMSFGRPPLAFKQSFLIHARLSLAIMVQRVTVDDCETSFLRSCDEATSPCKACSN
jgi:hypothetical protein